jgi:hypothetical protein
VGRKVRESVQDIVEFAGKQASITNISSNPVLAAMEIRMAWKENRRLRCELARTVLQKAIDKDGAVLSDGAGRMVFRGCLTDGWRQHQQVDSGRIRPCGQEGKYIQYVQISLVGNNSTGDNIFGRNKRF